MKSAAKNTSKPSAMEMRLLRDRLGLGKYRKTAQRDPEKKDLLLELALRKIRKAERDNFLPVGFRKRRVRFRAAR